MQTITRSLWKRSSSSDRKVRNEPKTAADIVTANQNTNTHDLTHLQNASISKHYIQFEYTCNAGTSAMWQVYSAKTKTGAQVN
jgi:hypothetical protein